MIQCPEPQMLRLYIAEALDGPCQQEVDAHIDSCESCQNALHALLPSVPIEVLGTSTVIEAPPLPPAEEAIPTVPGYSLSGKKLGSGGMGVVWLGRDTRLNRLVAIKVLRERLWGHPELRSRFIREAQTTSQLQHPGIPPVHELGTLADHRPFFAMKVVEGLTLADRLRDRSNPGEGLPALLAVFEQVCQAMAYAHSHGVLHRDLKPANIMVGAFGEVQVMDWGLAKVLLDEGTGEKDDTPAELMTASETPAETYQTEPGTVMGTYAYMPPEQASGEVERLDRRCDVFSLGAILCEILTGTPPYSGSAEQVRDMAQTAGLETASKRLAHCGMDDELVRLARWCLEKKPEGRPADAGVVAEVMSSHLRQVQDRLRKAEIDRASAEARADEETRTRQVAEAKVRVERRARNLVAGLAAAGLLLMVTVVGGAWQLWQRQKATNAGVIGLMAEARQLLRQARDDPFREVNKFSDARDRGRDALALAESGGSSFELIQQARGLLKDLERHADAAQRDQKLVATLMEVPGPWEGPKFERTSQGKLSPLPRASLDDLLRSAFLDWGLDLDRTPVDEMVARLEDCPLAIVFEVVASLDRWGAECRRIGHGERARRLRELAETLDRDSRRRELRSLVADDSLVRERALAMLSMVFRPVPIPFDTGHGPARQRLQELAATVDTRAEPVLGISLLARALQDVGNTPRAESLLRATLRDRPQIVSLYYVLASLLEKQGRRAEVIECYAAARALRPTLGVALARTLIAQRRTEEGRALFERLLAERLDSPWLHEKYGNSLHEQGLLPEAEKAFRQAIALQPDFVEAWYNLGITCFDQKQWQPAEAAFRQVIALRPTDDEAHIRLGDALIEQDRLKDAAAEYRRAVQLNSKNALAHFNLGTTLLDLDQPEDALPHLQRAIALNENDHEAHNNLGSVLTQLNRPLEAEAAYLRAIQVKPTYPNAYYNLGNVLLQQGKVRQAEKAYRQAIVHRPGYTRAWFNLGNSLIKQNDWPGAEAAFRKAIAINGKFSPAYGNLGHVLLQQDKMRDAENVYRINVKLWPGNPLAHQNLARVLQAQVKYQAAVDVLRKAVRSWQDSPDLHDDLGKVLCNQGNFAAGEQAFQEAIKLRPKVYAYHFNLGVALLAQGKPAKAEASFRQVLQVRSVNADARRQVAVALMEQGKFADAIATLREGNDRTKVTAEDAELIRTWERFQELAVILPAIVSGEREVRDSTERLEVIRLCRLACNRLHAAAARFSAEAFEKDPRLADDLASDWRYNAACSAVLAAAGQAADGAKLPDKASHRLRRLALHWLSSDLALRSKQVNHSDPAIRREAWRALQYWQHDVNLASVRDASALARLAPSDSDSWLRLWKEVECLIRRMDSE